VYLKHFGLARGPFTIAPDPRFLYLSDQHREALAHLHYGVQSGGFVLLTGEVGTGKTTVCRCLLEQLPEDTDVALVLNPRVSALELIATVCDELHVDHTDAERSIKSLVDRLNRHLLDANARGRRTVVLIDEAQSLSADTLEQMRLLTNLETNERKLLQIIMVGQPELRDMLATPGMRQLAQRVTARYHLGTLSRREVESYVAHRLQVAGTATQPFGRAALRRVHARSGGIPRLVNTICDRALLGAYVQGVSRVDGATLERAAAEVLGRPAPRRAALPWLLAGLVVAGAAAGSYFGLRPPGPFREIAPVAQARAPAPPVPSPAATAPAAPPAAEPPAAPAAQAPAAAPQTAPPATATLDWPPGRPAESSLGQAFTALLSRWGVSYDAQRDGKPCAHAERFGLRCLQQRGELQALRGLDRPAVVGLRDPHAGAVQAALLELGPDSARIALADETRTVAPAELEGRWAGEYVVLWRPPPGYTGPSASAASPVVTDWLQERLAQILGGKELGPGGLPRAIVAFQSSQGLTTDGVAGPYTLIHLTNLLGEGPRLAPVSR
jgi:general secretion pathway protein A